MTHDPTEINRPKSADVEKLAHEIDDQTQIKKAFKGVRGGKPASAKVRLGRLIRKQNRGKS